MILPLTLAKDEGVGGEGRDVWNKKVGNSDDDEGTVGRLRRAERSGGGERQGLARDSAVLAVCWDDWCKGGVRERVLKLLEQ